MNEWGLYKNGVLVHSWVGNLPFEELPESFIDMGFMLKDYETENSSWYCSGIIELRKLNNE